MQHHPPYLGMMRLLTKNFSFNFNEVRSQVTLITKINYRGLILGRCLENQAIKMTLKYYVGNTRYTDLPTERLISMQRQVIKSKDVNNTKPGF